MSERQSDTRARIQEIALELFSEHGYDKTALREIAEHLGVTKAALYYHFKTKEDIVRSIVADGAEKLDDLIEWATDQPRTVETRREIVRRYAAMMQGQRKLMRFFQENQPVMRDLPIGDTMKRRMTGLFDLLTDEHAPLADQVRARLTVVAINAAIFAAQDLKASDEDVDAAALEVALDLTR